MSNVIIGVDGGGTKTNLAALDAETGRPLARAASGSINAYFAGMETAVSNLERGIHALGLSPSDRLLALGLGDPAMDDSGEADGAAFRSAIAPLLPPGTLCLSKSDVFMALYAFTGGAPGALVVAGTGSMGIGLAAPYRHGGDNPLLTVGGWGEPSGDRGSGNDIAVRGITAAMDAFDGIGPVTALCRAVTEFFGVGAPRELIGVFNGDALPRDRIAAFAKTVADCAEAGDGVSRRILEDAGTVLGKYACSLLGRIGGARPRLGAYGSVLVKNGYVRRVFTDTVQKKYPNADIGIPRLPPEYGAARFAADALGISWEETV